jgi:hypothetical protein
MQPHPASPDKSPIVTLIQFTDEPTAENRPLVAPHGLQPGRHVYVNLATFPYRPEEWVEAEVLPEDKAWLVRVVRVSQ